MLAFSCRARPSRKRFALERRDPPGFRIPESHCTFFPLSPFFYLLSRQAAGAFFRVRPSRIYPLWTFTTRAVISREASSFALSRVSPSLPTVAVSFESVTFCAMLRVFRGDTEAFLGLASVSRRRPGCIYVGNFVSMLSPLSRWCLAMWLISGGRW